MGASVWAYFVPYQPDIQAALQQLRHATFAKGDYYQIATRQHRIESSRDALAHLDEQEPDPELRAYMREWLQGDLERLEGLPDPHTIDERIAELFAVNADSGTHSILDITLIGDEPKSGVAAPLAPTELVAMFGTAKPTHADVAAHEDEVTELRRRWQGTYVITYKDGQPDEIFFGGFSGD